MGKHDLYHFLSVFLTVESVLHFEYMLTRFWFETLRVIFLQGMSIVGDRFGAGKMFLPQVKQFLFFFSSIYPHLNSEKSLW